MQLVDPLVKSLAEIGSQPELDYSQSYIRQQLGSGHSLPIWIHPEKGPSKVDAWFADSQRVAEWKRKLELAG